LIKWRERKREEGEGNKYFIERGGKEGDERKEV